MVIDNYPILNENSNTITIQNNIDTSEETVIFINGFLAFTDEDFSSISNNIITLNLGLDIDWNFDSIFVFYTKL